MKQLLIVYHSATGAAEQLARAAADGARSESVESNASTDAGKSIDADGSAHSGNAGLATRLLRAQQANADDLLAADGYLFAAPENLATLAGMMKDFFDRTYYHVLDRISGRPYAAIIAAGTDGEGAARQLARIATGLRLNEVAPPLIVRNGAQTPEQILAAKTVPANDLAQARELGAAIAAGLISGIF